MFLYQIYYSTIRMLFTILLQQESSNGVNHINGGVYSFLIREQPLHRAEISSRPEAAQ